MEDDDDMQVAETPKDRMVSPTIIDDFKSKLVEAQKGDSVAEFISAHNATTRHPEIVEAFAKLSASAKMSDELLKPREQRRDDGPSLGDQLSQILGPQFGTVGVPCLAILIAVLAFSPQFSQLVLVVGVCAGFMYLVKTLQTNVSVKSDQAIEQRRLDVVDAHGNTAAALTQDMAIHAKNINDNTLSTVEKLAQIRRGLHGEMFQTYERVRGKEIAADLEKKSIEEKHATERHDNSNRTRLAVAETQVRGQENIEAIRGKIEMGKSQVELEMNEANNKTKVEIQRGDQKTKEKIAKLENDTTLQKEQIQARVKEFKIAADKEVAVENERESTKQATIRYDAEIRKEEKQAQVEVHRADARVKEIEAAKPPGFWSWLTS